MPYDKQSFHYKGGMQPVLREGWPWPNKLLATTHSPPPGPPMIGTDDVFTAWQKRFNLRCYPMHVAPLETTCLVGRGNAFFDTYDAFLQSCGVHARET